MDLAAIEAIRRTKHAYLRCVDLKRWDEIGGTFTEDATADYGTPTYGDPIRLSGRDAIVGFLRERLVPEIITVHLATQPEIDVDGDTATGTWAFQDQVIATQHNVAIIGAAFYSDRYRREADGVWRISHTGYVRTYEAMLSLADLKSFQLTANRWAVPSA
ncbi:MULTISPECIES: nuclear transport factor 2 family protein [Amycolatopsis]|uniref:Nuclear transport factor 2 family protein n=1 Tax=Amycolatopsis tucumanensis TaxID=401106 RepID=A0ABP7ITQ9_9PSEU|nr:nuclear transport factor 2 family protein [Amycolatopsis tucumanensis]MCF6424072.1 nuclear transport factor 2 family protein [Amycolatopsis tucumanensis]